MTRHKHVRRRPRRRVLGTVAGAVVLAGVAGALAVAAGAATWPNASDQTAADATSALATTAVAPTPRPPTPVASSPDAASLTPAPAAPAPVEPTAEPTAEPTPSPLVPPGSTTAVVGDSLALGLRPVLGGELPDRRLEYTAKVGTSTPWMLSRLTTLARNGRLPPVVAISAGTNDMSTSTTAYAAHVRTAMAVAGPSRCVVWSTVSRPMRRGAATSINLALAQADAEYPNLLIVDWASMVENERGLLGSDRVHPTSRGLHARAAAYATAVESCSTPKPGVP